MRIAFLATPDFALPCLQFLYDAGHELFVFSQPDKQRGRGNNVSYTPVKALALSLGIPVFQFEKIKSDDGVAKLCEISPDLMVTVAFGQILTQRILDIPKHGCINVHASLLPKYRGAAPIQQSIIDGETETGVTTMYTELGLDTGDILCVQKTQIGENETSGELFDRLSVIGANVLKKTLDLLEAGTLTRTPQNDSLATKCKTIKKEDAKIDFSCSAQTIHNKVRGMNPSPIAFCMWGDITIKVYATRIRSDLTATGICGECVDFVTDMQGKALKAGSKNGLFITTGNGVLEICELQFPNSRRMSAKDALNSKKLIGEVLS